MKQHQPRIAAIIAVVELLSLFLVSKVNASSRFHYCCCPSSFVAVSPHHYLSLSKKGRQSPHSDYYCGAAVGGHNYGNPLLLRRRRGAQSVGFPFASSTSSDDSTTSTINTQTNLVLPSPPPPPQIPHKEEEEQQQQEQKKSEWEELQIGYQQIVSLEAFDGTHLHRLMTMEDAIGILIHLPLVVVAFSTALTGQVDAQAYRLCTAAIVMTSLAHAKMCRDEPRDDRAPRLAEPHSVYEFSALYLLPFAWLLFRIVTPLYPTLFFSSGSGSGTVADVDKILDIMGSLCLTAITIYGWAGAIWGKVILSQQGTTSETTTTTSLLEPSSPEYQTQAHLYLTGNIVINSLACLFVPFAWTLALRGTTWWNRVQELHPHQAAFLGVSLLVAILGDTSGNLLLRFQQLKITTSVRALVVMGIVSNLVFLMVPELVFNGLYTSGISEIGFYWE